MSARDKLLENPILFFAACAVAGYMLWPSIKQWVGVPDAPSSNHAGAPPMFDPFGLLPKANADQAPVPGAPRRRPPQGPYGYGDGWDDYGAPDPEERPQRRRPRQHEYRMQRCTGSIWDSRPTCQWEDGGAR